MNFRRHLLIVAVLAASMAGLADSSPTPAATAVPACVAANPFPSGILVIRAIHVYTGADGESAFETVEFHGESKAYFKPGELFSHTLLGAAKKVQLVAGPASVTLPLHAAPAKEMFLTVQGSSVVTLPNGQEQQITPGTLVIFDDQKSKTGHGGRTGPCGYVALNIVPDDPAPAATPATAPAANRAK